MKEMPPLNDPPSPRPRDAVVDGFTLEQSAEKTEKVLSDWVVALAKRFAQQDHAAALLFTQDSRGPEAK
ncbi:hypothetical protein HFN97_15425 [Rhizobium laguerreae]|nr:hypothetical protein [Rhizobium laguerreae]